MPDDTGVSLRAETAEMPAARRDVPQKQPERPAAMSPAPEKPLRSSRRRWVRWAMFALLPLALIAGAYWYVTGGQVMSTDNAYVQADKVGVSTDVSGIVQEIDVKENQPVVAGQVLYRLDPRKFQIVLESAKANLAQVALTIDSMKQDYQRMLSEIPAQQAQIGLDQANMTVTRRS
jgi:membrane fusion protein (multidrug efflux system)